MIDDEIEPAVHWIDVTKVLGKGSKAFRGVTRIGPRTDSDNLNEKKTRRRVEEGRVLWYAWFPSDFNAKTSHLTDEARNAYRELIDFAFLQGRNQIDLPDDDRYLMAAAKAKARQWEGIRYLLFECPKPMFTKTGDGFWRNARLAEEVEIALEKSGQAAGAARTRHDRNADDSDSHNVRNASAMRPHNERSATKKETQKEIQPSVEGERKTTTTRGREARPQPVTPAKESFLRMKVQEMRLNSALMEMAVHEPEDYEQAVRDLTGYSPDELADLLGDDAIRPHQKDVA